VDTIANTGGEEPSKINSLSGIIRPRGKAVKCSAIKRQIFALICGSRHRHWITGWNASELYRGDILYDKKTWPDIFTLLRRIRENIFRREFFFSQETVRWKN